MLGLTWATERLRGGRKDLRFGGEARHVYKNKVAFVPKDGQWLEDEVEKLSEIKILHRHLRLNSPPHPRTNNGLKSINTMPLEDNKSVVHL
jgi:hypothetical protein